MTITNSVVLTQAQFDEDYSAFNGYCALCHHHEVHETINHDEVAVCSRCGKPAMFGMVAALETGLVDVLPLEDTLPREREPIVKN